MEESCRPDGAISGVRGENLWKCSSVSGAITAYTLMSDEHGRGYRAQAVDYMKETLGIQGIQLLMKKYEQQKDIFEQQEKRGSPGAKSALTHGPPKTNTTQQTGKADRYGDTVLWGAGGYGSDKRDFSGVYDAASY